MKKLLSIISLVSLLINSFFAPLTVIAQDFTPAPIQSEPTPEPAQVVESTITPTPSIEATVEPTQELSQTAIPTEASAETSTPSSTPSIEATVEPTQEPVQSNEPTIEDISLKAVILENIASETVEEFDFSSNEYSSATLITDKADYSPTDTVLITGNGFLPNKEYGIEITSNTGNFKFSDKVTSDESGGLFYTFQLDGTYRPDYRVEVKDSNNVVSITTFTDSNHQGGGNPSADLDQYATIDAAWVNGNLGASKAAYYEGDSVPYRIRFDNLSLSSHNVVIEWDTTKSDKHALDFLTSFNRTVVTANPCSGVTSCGTKNDFPIPVDPQVSGAGVVPIPGNFSLYGGTITAVSAYSYPNGSGFTGDKSARLTITFTATQNNPVLSWGGHIANRTDWGQNNSAISIPGSPYHSRLIDLDGSGGNQDRSLSADAVIYPATITITKDAIPNNSQDFIFTTSGLGLSDFSLDDDSDSVLSNTKTFSITSFSNNNGDAKTIIESVASGWLLTNLVCNDNNGTVNIGTRTVSLLVTEGELITCTFTNTLQNGTVVVHKDVQGPNGENITDTSNDFSVQLDGSNTQSIADGGSYTYNNVSSGSHTVTESLIPTGYSLYGISTTQGGSGNTSGLAFNVVAGQTTHVYITNRQLAGKLIVDKVTIPNDTQEVFSITASGGTISGSTTRSISTGSDVTYDVYAGTYSVTEALKTGWKETGNTCTNVVVGLGETKTCTITNTKQGKIIVKKETTPDGDPQSFEFVSSYSNNFSLTDGGQNESTFLDPSSYSVSENVPTGWTLSSSSCDDGSNVSAINLSAGETVTCTFNNTKLGKIIVEKQTLPDGSNQVFEFVPSYASNFNLTDGLTNTSGYLLPGAYSVSETSVSGWDTTSICDDGSTPRSIDLSAGETIKCTFTNTQRGSIYGYKYEDQDGSNSTTNDRTVVSGWTIELWQGLTKIAETVTGADGKFTFSDLIFGDYKLIEKTVLGWFNVAPGNINVNLTAGENDGPNNFINFEKATIVVHKNVLDEFGNEIDDSKVFKVEIDGTNTKDISEGNDVIYSDLLPGTYAISEVMPVPDGYEFVSMTNSGVVTVASGQTHNVYIVNKQIPGSIKIIKDTIGGNDSFSFSSTTLPSASFNISTVKFTGNQEFNNLGAGAYDVSEIVPAGWTLTGLTCFDPDGESLVDLSKGEILVDLDFAETVTCTYTNSKKPQLTVIKHVIIDNGGTAVASDFSINVTGVNPDKTTFAGNESGTLVTLDPGSYSVDEDYFEGYTKSLSTDCSGTLEYGDSKTCTVTNNDDPGILIIKKIIDGGSKVYEDFGFRVNGEKTTYFEPDGQNDRTVDAGYYTVVENVVDGYSTSYENCTRVLITNGGSQTCTITNTRDQGEIIIRKIIDEDGDLNTLIDQTKGIDWQIDVDGIVGDIDDPSAGNTDSNGEYKTGKVKTGFYYANETQQNGYDFVSASCSDGSTIDNINLDKDEIVTCTFYNTPNGTIHGYKWNDQNGNGEDLFEQEDKLGSWTINLFAWNDKDDDYTDLIKSTLTDNNIGPDYGWYWFTHLFPGNYKICEQNINGWTQTYPSGDGCHLVTIPDVNPNQFRQLANFVSESPVYKFGNQEDNPQVSIDKSNDKSSGANIGDIVTYTLMVKNSGNINLSNLKIKDAIPGGFTYVVGSSNVNGSIVADPTISGGLLTWGIGDISKGEEIKLIYQLKIGDNAVKGSTYKNYATCSAYYGRLQSNELGLFARIDTLSQNETECNVSDSSVKINKSYSYGGNLYGQVLGASIELPATGNPTWILALAILGLGSGFLLKKKYAKN